MANTYKNAGFDLTTTNKTDIYTCPANTTVIIKTIQTTNSSSGNVDVVGYLYDSSETTEYELAHHTLTSKGSINFIDGTLVLEAGDVFRLDASTANVISGVISLLEIDF